MRDPRIQKWADVLVNYSLQAKPGQHAVIVSEPEAMPLLEACVESLLQAKATVEPFVIPRSFTEILFEQGSDGQISKTPPVMRYAAETCDLYLSIGADANTKLLANHDPSKQALASLARLPIMQAIMERAAKKEMRWVYTHFPTPSAAQEAEMGTREYEEFIFSLGFLNEDHPVKLWERFSDKQQKLIDFLTNKKELHFTNAAGTDLTVNVEGMRWVNCSGKINFPDGEVYTGPNLNAKDGGVNGVAKFSFPTLYRNVLVEDIALVFEKGKVKEATASKGEKFLHNMISQDDGASRVGEIAIGTNYRMNRITKNILFDEKFGGTFHLALGNGYPQTGNHNKSGLHWDMIFDLRNGSIAADRQEFYRDGKFIDFDFEM